jgi:hypothetical protein
MRPQPTSDAATEPFRPRVARSLAAAVVGAALILTVATGAWAPSAAVAAPDPVAAAALAIGRAPVDRRDGLIRHRRHRASDALHFVTLKYGTYDPKGSPDGGAFLGLRTGAEFDNRLTLSFNVDAYWRSYAEQITIAQDVDPNGNLITASITRFATSSTLIPLGVSLGLRLPGSRTVTPFVGVGVAYEILVNEVEDYESGIDDTNVYGGPGWQVFGGLMVPVTHGARFLGELWLNDAEVSRDVETYERGLPVREAIDVSGLGARFGVEFRFD